MNYWNKKVIISVVLLVATVFVIGFGIGFLNTEDGFDTTPEVAVEKVDKPVAELKETEATEKISYYLVGEEEGSIKMYFVDGEKATVIKSEEISLDVLPKDDISLLSKGIKTHSADEALAIWENFIS